MRKPSDFSADCQGSLRVGVLAACLLAAVLPARAEHSRQVLTAGPVTVELTPRPGGLRILCDGLEVVRHSELVVTRPPWAPHYYVGPTEDAVRTATQALVEGGTQVRMVHRGDDDSFTATETITVTGDGRVEQVFEGRLRAPNSKALVQWRIGGLNPTLLVGCPFEATLKDGQTVAGTVPVTPLEGSANERKLASGFTSLTLLSRIGPIRIEVREGPPLIVYDYRLDCWATPQNPFFWFGDLGSGYQTGAAMRYHVVYHLPQPAGRTQPPLALQGQAMLTRQADAQAYPVEDPPLLVPRPKEATFGAGGFLVPSPLPIAAADERTTLARAELARFLTDGLGRTLITTADDEAPGCLLRPTSTPDLPSEGYRLSVTPAGIIIEAADERGFLYGVQTLKQLTTRTPAGEVLVRAAEIRDWPSLRFRGIHLFTGGRGPDLHLRLIRDILGALKLNHLVLQSEYIKWDAFPEIHHPQYGMPKADIRQILAACGAQGIEVTPLVMSLGHCQWIFETGHHLDLAEDPEAKWAYCVTNPRTYEFIFKVYEEALELFRPRWFHIGHDEYSHRGRVPFRESSKPFTVEALFLQDTLRLHAWLAERGVRTMMWGDMLLAQGEAPDACHARCKESAAALRAQLPDDIIIADWHYCGSPPEDFTSLASFHAAGHETVAATWDQPHNIVNFARAAHQQQSLGLLQTTWAGYSLDEASFQRELHQYAAYVLAAEAAWNADAPPAPDSFPAKSLFLDYLGLSALRQANSAGWLADLSSAYNYPLKAAGPEGWFGLGSASDLSAVPGGVVRLKGVAFQLGDVAGGAPAAIVLRSKLAPDPALPTDVQIAIRARAARLVVLHTMSFACAPGGRVGQCEIQYEDGQAAMIDLIYGENAFAYTDLTATAAAPLVWTGRTTGGAPVALRALVWEHPRPAQVIAALTIRTADAAGSLVILGLTGLERPAAAE